MIGTLAIAFVVYLVAKSIYRITFHPLAKIPGPKIAAITSLWNAYHDIVGEGLVKQMPALHEKYGPIVRTQPNECHIGDIEGYSKIFKIGTHFDRVWHHNPFLTGSIQSKEKLTETKKRRDFLSPFFSKAAISRVEPELHRKKLMLFLDALEKTDGTVVSFFYAFRCLSLDIVTDYCFQDDLGCIEAPGFQHEVLQMLVEGFELPVIPFHYPAFFNVVTNIILSLPENIRKEKFSSLYGFELMQKLARERVYAAVEVAKKGGVADDKIPTMFDVMLAPDKSKGQVSPPLSDMVADGCLQIAAGTDTTGNALTYILWYITQNPHVEATLLEELKRGIGKDEIVSSATLEGPGFEYLRAVVKEGLRLAHGVPGRIIRKVPEEGATFNGHFVAPGTIVTSGQYIHNTNAEAFPDPFKYDPERWLIDDVETLRMRDRHMVSFSKGSRACLGINLAYATMHLTVAHVIRRFEITTTGYTTANDMDWSDHFVIVTNGKIKGMVKKRED